jgi:hypothetical protein
VKVGVKLTVKSRDCQGSRAKGRWLTPETLLFLCQTASGMSVEKGVGENKEWIDQTWVENMKARCDKAQLIRLVSVVDVLFRCFYL